MEKIILTIVVTIIAMFTINAQGYIYVDVNATGNESGFDWGNAFTSLEDAVNYATSGDTILIKAGVYKQQADIGKSIAIYGGFNGTETSYTEADPEANLVIFDADLNGNDIPNDYVTNKTDNLTYHLNIQNFDTLQSFMIIIEGITFKNAKRLAYSGSAVFLRAEGVTTINVNFSKCKFLQNCNASNGSSGGIGGGAVGIDALNGGSAIAIFDKCLFDSNADLGITTYGSAVALFAGTQAQNRARFVNCIFTGNTDVGNNGGNYVIYQANSSTGTANTLSDTRIINCTFYGNNNSKAVLYWNGNSLGGSLTSIFNRNIIAGGDSTMVIGNTATSSNDYTIQSYNNYWMTNPLDNVAGLIGSNSIVGTTPGFVNAASGDFNLTASSPCLDVQNIPANPVATLYLNDAFDYAGNNRFVDSGIDIGAYEYQGSMVGINDIEPTVQNLYPNPTNTVLNIELKEATQVRIVNVLGEIVATQKLNAGSNRIDVNSFNSGVYFLQTENGSATKFIIK